ncbi:MAG: ABC-type multidrug/protein/lipid transport system, ATPase component [Anaerolineae bacterium]|nr:MAG: ABC-type multidrug/protein/lipid transport system, ATPase component [Anaerolineae bacterium]
MNQQPVSHRNRSLPPAMGPGRGPGPFGGRPHLAGMGRVEKARDLKGALRKLLQYLGEYRLAVVLVSGMALISTILMIFGPKVLGMATTTLFEGVIAQMSGRGSIDFGTIRRFLLITLGLYGISALLNFWQGWLMADIALKITYRLRKDVMQKIQRLPFRYFDKTTHGEVLSFLTNDVDTINQTLNQSLTQIITSLATVVGVLVMMLSINWIMTLVALVMVPLSFFLVMVIIRNSQRYFSEQQDQIGHVNGHVEESFGAHQVIKIFNGEQKSLQKFDLLNNRLYDAAWKAQFFSGVMMPLMGFMGNLGFVAVTIIGGWLVIRKVIAVGDIQAFIQYVRMFTQPITQIANISNVLQQTAAAAERVFDFLAQEEEPLDTQTVMPLREIRGNVEFREVYFGYQPDQMVIKNFSAKIQAGQKVAIVGPTGAGKTTLVKLLMRFYDVDRGAILIDGVDIRQFPRGDLRCLFGMVLQDAWLFNGTILENIRYGYPAASDFEVVQAAQAANIDHFIRTLPEGYNMVLNEEVTNLSQGQKQLMTIARAILIQPQMLILDEATSSVDTHTELLIQAAMEKMMQGRTSFIIAHRLSTIRNADLILVIKDGNIVEQGDHESLLQRNGFYAELYRSQFEPLPEAVG